ncbi:hypothetical protein ACFV2U_39925 [Streptomyces sp. NPDC059697]|uniref:AraC-like ligand-binding domain-containing protein n=1 Tax=Streptomyces sp. NPDC059697 TaxID=3346912 RepID=UPI00368E587B
MMGRGVCEVIETVLRSEELPVADRFEWWREVTSHTLMPTELTSDHADDFRASARALELGAVQASVLSYPSLRSRRTPALMTLRTRAMPGPFPTTGARSRGSSSTCPVRRFLSLRPRLTASSRCRCREIPAWGRSCRSF